MNVLTAQCICMCKTEYDLIMKWSFEFVYFNIFCRSAYNQSHTKPRNNIKISCLHCYASVAYGRKKE